MIKGVAGAVLVFALVVAVGCGGGSDAEPLTKAEFTQQGNKICAVATHAREKIIAKLIEETDPNGNQEAAQVKLIDRAMPSYESAAEQLGDLGAPKGEEEKVQNLVAAMEDAAAQAKADPHTAVASNVPFRKADKVAEELDLKECLVGAS